MEMCGIINVVIKMKFDKIDNPEKLLEFMSENIKYGFVGKNGKVYNNQNSEDLNDWYEQCLVQTGDQVLKTKVGTCWDQVEMERLWFEKRNYEIKTIFIWFEVNYGNDYPTHTFLLYQKNGKWYWFENSFEACRGIHEFNTIEEAIECVKTRQLEYAISIGVAKQEDKEFLKDYEYSKLVSPLNVDEYINHVTTSVDKKQL